MRIQLTRRHCEVPDTVVERAERLFAGLTRYNGRLSAADVIFREEGRECEVEGVLSIDGDRPVVAHGTADTFDSAVDRTIDRLVRMLKERRSRKRDHYAPKPDFVEPLDDTEADLELEMETE